MKKKKLYKTTGSFLLSLLLWLNLVGCAVALALLSAGVQIGGKISFTADRVEATISDGVLSGGTDANSKSMAGFTIDYYSTEDDITTAVANWTGMDISLDEGETEATISFSITNDSTSKSLKSTLSTTTESLDNMTMSITANETAIESGASTIAQTSGVINYVITFAVTNESKDASISSFSINFNLENYQTYTVTMPSLGSTFIYKYTTDGTTFSDFTESFKCESGKVGILLNGGGTGSTYSIAPTSIDLTQDDTFYQYDSTSTSSVSISSLDGFVHIDAAAIELTGTSLTLYINGVESKTITSDGLYTNLDTFVIILTVTENTTITIEFSN